MPALLANVKAHFQFDETSGNIVERITGAVLTPTGWTYNQAGKVTAAADLDGSTSYALGTEANFGFLDLLDGGAQTWMFWLNPDNTSTGNGMVIAKRRNSSGNNGWYIKQFHSAIEFFFADGTTAVNDLSANGLTQDAENCVIVKYRENADGVKIKINDVDKSPAAQNTAGFGAVTTNDDVVVGGSYATGPIFSAFYDGSISDLIIFSEFTSDAKDSAYYASGSGRNFAAAPTISSVSPDNDDIGDTGTLTITGTNFDLDTPTSVKIGTLELTSITVVNATTITAAYDLTGQTAGAKNVTVTMTYNGTGTLTNGFTVNAANVAPTVTGIVPNRGSRGKRVPVEIYGTFDGTETAKLAKTGFADINLQGVSFVGTSVMRGYFDLDAGNYAGKRNLVVTDSAANATTRTDAFWVMPPNGGRRGGKTKFTLNQRPNPRAGIERAAGLMKSGMSES